MEFDQGLTEQTTLESYVYGASVVRVLRHVDFLASYIAKHSHYSMTRLVGMEDVDKMRITIRVFARLTVP